MTIILFLIKDGAGLDLEALLGHIVIADGCRAIKAKYTYLDSWLDALIRGLQTIRKEPRCVIDLVDEPEPLVFDLFDTQLRVSYEGTTIEAGSADDFAASLRTAASLFLETVREEAGELTSELLREIQRFASNK